MNPLLSLQRVIGLSDGVAAEMSNFPKIKPGDHYWVCPIDEMKEGIFVLVVAKRGWMGRNKRLIRNYIIKKVEKIEVSSVSVNHCLLVVACPQRHNSFYY